MTLRPLDYYQIGNTPIHHAKNYCPEGTMLMKCESQNPTGSSKDRLAYALLDALPPHGHPDRPTLLFDSTSGNFGIAMANLVSEMDVRFMALVDETTASHKLTRLFQQGAELRVIERGPYSDGRSARIAAARELAKEPGWAWMNQYENPIGFHIHFNTTGPEVYLQSEGSVRSVVCSIGTGGTLCGIGAFLKNKDPSISVIAVEPEGSTIFGGSSGCYANAGAGMHGPSGLVQRFGGVIDSYCKVPDSAALFTCREFAMQESMSIGLTGGAAAFVGAHIARQHPMDVVVVLVADSGDAYCDLIQAATTKPAYQPVVHRVGNVGSSWATYTEHSEINKGTVE